MRGRTRFHAEAFTSACGAAGVAWYGARMTAREAPGVSTASRARARGSAWARSRANGRAVAQSGPAPTYTAWGASSGGTAIGPAQAAAEIGARDGMTVAAKRANELGHLGEGGLERRQVGDLAADMDIDADDANCGEPRGEGIGGTGPAPRHAELRFRRA